eukprot:TRINITY_DN3713_c0_g1_i1.p1 TRINITY_DN3713_c0_g1~~TRINITY_DN3713_c0_g1_i1.p1  ORF type:complete len:241 (-),score=53.09 TRINITY_DN3713_c0_g1_i1:64-786(-)
MTKHFIIVALLLSAFYATNAASSETPTMSGSETLDDTFTGKETYTDDITTYLDSGSEPDDGCDICCFDVVKNPDDGSYCDLDIPKVCCSVGEFCCLLPVTNETERQADDFLCCTNGHQCLIDYDNTPFCKGPDPTGAATTVEDTTCEVCCLGDDHPDCDNLNTTEGSCCDRGEQCCLEGPTVDIGNFICCDLGYTCDDSEDIGVCVENGMFDSDPSSAESWHAKSMAVVLGSLIVTLFVN